MTVQTSLRLPDDVYEALSKLSAVDARSINGEMLYIIREYLVARGLLPKP